MATFEATRATQAVRWLVPPMRGQWSTARASASAAASSASVTSPRMRKATRYATANSSRYATSMRSVSRWSPPPLVITLYNVTPAENG